MNKRNVFGHARTHVQSHARAHVMGVVVLARIAVNLSGQVALVVSRVKW